MMSLFWSNRYPTILIISVAADGAVGVIEPAVVDTYNI